MPNPCSKHVIYISFWRLNLPCDRGCIGFPLWITSSGHKSIDSDYNNNQSCKYTRHTKYCEISIKLEANFEALFDKKSSNKINVFMWSWYTIRQYNSNLTLIGNPLNQPVIFCITLWTSMGFTTTPFSMLQFQKQNGRNSTMESWQIFARTLLGYLIIHVQYIIMIGRYDWFLYMVSQNTIQFL